MMGSDSAVDRIFENVPYFESRLMDFDPVSFYQLADILVSYSTHVKDRKLLFISSVLTAFSRRLRSREDIKNYDVKSLKEEWEKLVPCIIQTTLKIKESYDSNDQTLIFENVKELFSYISTFETFCLFRIKRISPPSEQEIEVQKEELERLKRGMIAMAEELERLKRGMIAIAEEIRKPTPEESPQNEE